MTASARSISSGEKRRQLAAGRQRGVGDQHVDGAGLVEQPRRGARVGEVRRDGPAAQLGRERLERLGAPAGQHDRRAARGEPARDRAAEPARRAGEQDRAPAEVHAKTATVAVKPCTKYSPPTGPISPAAKKPAAGAPPSAASSAEAS